MSQFPLRGYDRSALPVGYHPGAFGYKRKNHTHEGIDLYGSKTDLVFAIEPGTVIAIYQFTGEAVGMPWWHDTWAITIADTAGIWVYGEVQQPRSIVVGDVVKEGQYIAQLKQVLKVDKGLPMTMLHLERWRQHTAPHTFLWQNDTPQPEFLLDPTPLLLSIP